jgi:hypothetical protein
MKLKNKIIRLTYKIDEVNKLLYTEPIFIFDDYYSVNILSNYGVALIVSHSKTRIVYILEMRPNESLNKFKKRIKKLLENYGANIQYEYFRYTKKQKERLGE